MDFITDFGVIFDMDGTLFDTQKYIHEAEKILFHELGIDIFHEEHLRYTAQRSWELWAQLKNEYDLSDDLPRLVDRHRRFGFEYMRQKGITPITGVPQFLNLLAEENTPMALASSGWKERIDSLLASSGLRKYFTAIVYGDDVAKSKPHPGIFLAAAERLGLTPMHCVVIEDSGNGIQAAKNAHMAVAGYRNFNSGKQDLSMADLVFDDYRKLSIKELNKISRWNVQNTKRHP